MSWADELRHFVSFWRRCQTSRAPFVHPDDRRLIVALARKRALIHGDDASLLVSGAGNACSRDLYRRYVDFVRSSRFGASDDKCLHLQLLPQPYVGNLATADIFLLSLNPGFDVADYWGELEHAGFRKILIGNLHQRPIKGRLAFPLLDPSFSWHGGYRYWESKLRTVIQETAAGRTGGYQGALEYAAKRLAALELVPYHSTGFRARELIAAPTAEAMKRFVLRGLLPRAKRGEILIVVLRRARDWQVPQRARGVVIYQPKHARSASLGKMSPGGRAILRRLRRPAP